MNELQWLFAFFGLALLGMVLMGAWDAHRDRKRSATSRLFPAPSRRA